MTLATPQDDPKYPIYYMAVRWSMDGEHDAEYPNSHKGLPEGRKWNSTGFSRMFREDPGMEEVERIAAQWWEKYTKKGANPSEPEFTVT